MAFVRSASLVLLMLATSGAYAQQAETQQVGSKAKKTMKKARTAPKKSQPDAAAIQAQREAAARAQAEQEARQRAEADAKQQAERQQAEIEAREKPLREADALIKNGKPAEAYALLEPLEFDRAGEVRFDYLIGIAALDSGKSDKATLAFERVLTVDPNFAGARLDMARAYYQLGDLPRAKTEFEIVLRSNPPAGARITTEKYLAAIDAQTHALDTRVTGYLEGIAGHDSNVNNATAQSQIALPAFGNLVFTLSPSNLKAGDYYMGLAGGVDVAHPVSEKTTLYAGADVHQRNHMVMNAFNPVSVDGRAGALFALGKEDSLRAGVVGGQYTLGNLRNRDSLGINGEWNHVFNPANQMSLFVQQMTYRYVDPAMKTQDFDQSVLGAAWRHVRPDGKSAVFASMFYGLESDVAAITVANPTGGRPDGRKRFVGVRVGGQTAWSDKTELFASAGWNGGSYARTNVLFLANRRDVLYDMTMGANWRWAKSWSLRPQLSLTSNRSNISLYSYSRVDVSVAVRRDFN